MCLGGKLRWHKGTVKDIGDEQKVFCDDGCKNGGEGGCKDCWVMRGETQGHGDSQEG